MDLPRVRRYRKGVLDRLYVEDADGRADGWADAASGDIHVQIPGTDERIEAAVEAWALAFPEDDLAEHVPGRNTWALARAWGAEILALEEDARTISEMQREAEYQRDQYAKGNTGEQRVEVALNALHEHGWGVLHSIPVFDGRSDIDHLLIGPGGVWTVNSKAHGSLHVVVRGDRVSVGRTYVDYVRSARHEAALVTRVLRSHGHDITAKSAVALDLDPTGSLQVFTDPDGVLIDTTPFVVDHLRDSQRTLDQATINAVFATARQRVTWENLP